MFHRARLEPKKIQIIKFPKLMLLLFQNTFKTVMLPKICQN